MVRIPGWALGEPATVAYKAGDIGPPDAMFIREDIDWRECGVLEWRIE